MFFLITRKGYKLDLPLYLLYFKDAESEIEVPRDVRNSKVQNQDTFRRDWSQY